MIILKINKNVKLISKRHFKYLYTIGNKLRISTYALRDNNYYFIIYICIKWQEILFRHNTQEK